MNRDGRSLVNAKKVLDWLLEEDQPSIRFLALTQLVGKAQDAPEVLAAKELIPEKGWAADLLAQQHRDGWWVSDESLYGPKYLSTNWMLLTLSDFGLTNDDPRIAKACELWLRRMATADGGFAPSGGKKGHLCTTGNMARALVRFGYTDHPKVRSAFQWLAGNREKKGGWSCFGGGGKLDSWGGVGGVAGDSRQKWEGGIESGGELGGGVFLGGGLHR